MSNEDLGSVLGRIPSGIVILTARGPQGQQTGMLASWVQQASFEPPAVTVAVNIKRYVNDWMTDGASVAVSVIGETQKNLLSHFGKGFEPDEPAFEGLETSETSAGLVVLADCLGWLTGTIRASVDAGDHRVYVIRLNDGQTGPRLADEKPYVHIRKNGFSY